MKLEVANIHWNDVYKDIARIPDRYRIDIKGRQIPEGRICRVTVGNNSALLSLRGQNEHSSPVIHIDEKIRQDLGLIVGSELLDFQFRPVGWIGQFRWAWRASDAAYRIAARLGLLSVILGIIGVVLGGVGIWIARSN
jgi:hypothetical protein